MEHDLIRRSKLLAEKCMIRGHLDTGSPCPSKVKAVPVDVIEREPAVRSRGRDAVMDKKILDVTCGSRSIWFDKNHPAAVYCDKRQVIYNDCWKSGDGNSTRTCIVKS